MTSKTWRLGALSALVAFAVVFAPPAFADPGNGKKIGHSARAEAATTATGFIDVIVAFDEHPGPNEHADMHALEARTRRTYEHLPTLALTIPARALEAVAKSKGVRFVSLDDEIKATSEAGRVTANTPPLGSYEDVYYNGGGYRVAVIDSGVANHPDIPLVGQADFVSTPPRAGDPYGHGTHVAGIISGYGSAAYFTQWGLAWNAPIISLRVLDENGSGKVSTLLAALDWLLANHATHAIRVANLSLGTGIGQHAANDPLVQAVEAVWDAGVVVVCSAGNFGTSGFGTITSPGNSQKVITVGSLTDSGTGTDPLDDHVSTYSSRGPTIKDNFLKPDLVAPGNRVIAPMAERSTLMRQLPERIATCGSRACAAPFFELSGTSMAAPMVSGTAIRMIGKDPTVNPASVKARLMKTARTVEGSPIEVGAGLLDITAALYATDYAKVAPSPKMGLSQDGTKIFVDDVSYTWGPSWHSALLWDDGLLWSDALMWDTALLWSDGLLWGDGLLWSDVLLWDEGLLWSDGLLWGDALLWDDALLWADVFPTTSGLYTSGETGAMSCDDDPGSSPVTDADATGR